MTGRRKNSGGKRTAIPEGLPGIHFPAGLVDILTQTLALFRAQAVAPAVIGAPGGKGSPALVQTAGIEPLAACLPAGLPILVPAFFPIAALRHRPWGAGIRIGWPGRRHGLTPVATHFFPTQGPIRPALATPTLAGHGDRACGAKQQGSKEKACEAAERLHGPAAFQS